MYLSNCPNINQLLVLKCFIMKVNSGVLRKINSLAESDSSDT